MGQPPGALWARIEAALERDLARPALTFLDARLAPRAYDAGALLACVRGLAARLRALALPPGPALGILLESQQAQALHFLAALAAGRTPALLTPPSRKLDRAYYLATTRAALEGCRFAAVVTDVGDLGPAVTALRPYALDVVRPGPPDDGPAGDAEAAGAFLQFTSGTTGLRRGVLVRDAAALAQVDAYAEAIALGPDDRVVSWLPLYHDMGLVTALVMPLARGVPAAMLQPLDWVGRPAAFLQAVARHGGTLAWMPNFAFAFLADRVREAELAGVALGTLRGLVNCSEPVTHEAQARFLARFAPLGVSPNALWGCYAMAETTFAVTHGTAADAGYLDPRGPDAAAPGGRLPYVSTGRPVRGAEVMVCDAGGAPLPDRRAGELRVRAPFLFGGYYRDPEATRAAFADGWYRTGDLGYRVGGEVFVSGRRKDLLILSGANVHAEDVEAVVSGVPGVRPGRVSAFAEFDEAAQTERAVVLAESAAPAEERAALVLEVRRRVAAAFQVTGFAVHLVEPGALVKSSAGKMARSANRERFAHLTAGRPDATGAAAQGEPPGAPARGAR
nr:hypothetical protein [uncultured bacterium]